MRLLQLAIYLLLCASNGTVAAEPVNHGGRLSGSHRVANCYQPSSGTLCEPRASEQYQAELTRKTQQKMQCRAFEITSAQVDSN